MQLFKRHIIVTILLTIYFLWWIFVFYWNYTRQIQKELVCGLPILGMVFLSLAIIGIYSLGFILKLVSSKEPNQTDYMIFLGFALLPAVLGGVYILAHV